MGRTFPIVTSCKIQKVRSRQLFMILIGLSTSLALVDMQTMQMRCVFCQTMLCTRSSTSSYGFGSLPSPLSPSFTSCTGQNSLDPKDFLLPIVLFFVSVYFLCRICLLSIPAFRVLVTKTWWTRENLFIIFHQYASSMPTPIVFTLCTILPAARKSDLSLEVEKVVEQLSYPDWIVLSLIHSNLTTVNFQNFLEDLAYQHNPKSQ